MYVGKMDPAQSLFCGGADLQLDNLDQQQREEEAEEREEAARIDAQLAQKLEGAFDDLDFETDDDDSSLCSPPGAVRHEGLLLFLEFNLLLTPQLVCQSFFFQATGVK